MPARLEARTTYFGLHNPGDFGKIDQLVVQGNLDLKFIAKQGETPKAHLMEWEILSRKVQDQESGYFLSVSGFRPLVESFRRELLNFQAKLQKENLNFKPAAG